MTDFHLSTDENQRQGQPGSDHGTPLTDLNPAPFAAIFHALPDAMLIVDRQMHIIEANLALRQLAGRDHEQLIGQPVQDFGVHLNLRNRSGSPLKHLASVAGSVLQTDKALSEEYLLTRSDGQERHVRLVSNPFVNNDSEIAGVIMVLHDLTDFYTAEQTRDRFLALAAHELRNPLAAAVGAVEMITHLRQHGRLSEERLDRYLPVLHNQLARLSIRVENLAETTRLQHSPLQLTPEWLNLVDLVRRSLQNLQSGRNDIVADLPQDAIMGHFDRARITQIMDNLLDHALKYKPEESAVQVSLNYQPASTPSTSAQVLIQVSDQGMSVARADLPHVFDRFYRAEQTTQTQRSVGMGLYVVRAIAQAHGGSVWADSPAAGEGLTISVQLPCTPREAVLSHSHSQA